MQKEGSSSYESWLAVSFTVGSLIILIIAIIAAISSNAPTQDLLHWVVIAAAFMLWGAPPLGAITIVLGLRLKNRGKSIANYGVVIGIGAALILVWLLFWLPLFFR